MQKFQYEKEQWIKYITIAIIIAYTRYKVMRDCDWPELNLLIILKKLMIMYKVKSRIFDKKKNGC